MRINRTLKQQTDYYEVEDFCDYLYESYEYGNFEQFKTLFLELNKQGKLQFIDYLFVVRNAEENRDIIRDCFRIILKIT